MIISDRYSKGHDPPGGKPINQTNQNRIWAGGRRALLASYSRCGRGPRDAGHAGARATLSVSARAAAAMGNQHSASHHSLKPRKNVHWKSAGTAPLLALSPGTPTTSSEPVRQAPEAPVSMSIFIKTARCDSRSVAQQNKS